MFDPPIKATATVTGNLNSRVYQLELPNGKTTVGHVPKSLVAIHDQLTKGVTVELEMTPYDFEKARIVGILPNN